MSTHMITLTKNCGDLFGDYDQKVESQSSLSKNVNRSIRAYVDSSLQPMVSVRFEPEWEYTITSPSGRVIKVTAPTLVCHTADRQEYLIPFPGLGESTTINN